MNAQERLLLDMSKDQKRGLKRLGILILGSMVLGFGLSFLKLRILDEGHASSYLPLTGLLILPFILEWTSKAVKRQTTDSEPIQISKFSGFCFLIAIVVFTVLLTVASQLDRL